MKLKFKSKTSYGTKRFYFTNKEKQKAFQRLTGKKTFTPEDVKNLEKLAGVKATLKQKKSDLLKINQ